MGDPPESGPPEGAPTAAEQERLRRRLGLSPLEWALSGGFAEQRDQTEPVEIPEAGTSAGEEEPG